MNAPQLFRDPFVTASAVEPRVRGEDTSVNFAEVWDVLVDNRWVIAIVTAIALVLGAAYALLVKPVYEANLLIQVEDSKGAATSILGEASSLFDVKTPAVGEIEIIRSRMVIGQAVENTKIYIDAHPRYLPVVGNWLARHASGLSDPGLLGLGGYVYGNEEIQVSHLETSIDLEGEPIIITSGVDDRFTLQHLNLPKPLEGRVGNMLTFKSADGQLDILIAKLNGRPGAQFTVTRTSRLKAIERLQTLLQLTEKGRQSGVIDATLRDSDPQRLSIVLNEIGRQYVRQNVERKAAEAQKTLTFLNDQLPQYKRQQEEAENAYNQYRNKKGTVAFDEEAKLILGQTVELQTKLLDAKQRRKGLEARFTDNHPTMQTLDSQIVAWTQEINGLNARVKGMPQIQQDALRMERDVRVNSEMYQSLLNNALQLSLVKEGKIGNVRLLDEAIIPEVPVKPRKSLVVGIAAVLGLVVGILLALARNSLAQGVRNPDEVEAQTGLSVYATIPLSVHQGALAQRVAGRKPGNHLLTLVAPDDPAVESLRSLRTALQFAMLEAPNNRVVISGATPGVGKTFVSSNFAAVLAAGGKRVLLVDADMRKGYVNQHFGLPRDRGLSEWIAGSLELEDVIRAEVMPGLDVITTGVIPPNPAELMMSDAFGRKLDAVSQRYDIVVIDTPPVLVAADTAAVAPHAGVVLLVARAEVTHVAELQESVRRLAHTGKPVNGVLFNAIDIRRRHFSRQSGRYGGYRYAHYAYESIKAEA